MKAGVESARKWGGTFEMVCQRNNWVIQQYIFQYFIFYKKGFIETKVKSLCYRTKIKHN